MKLAAQAPDAAKRSVIKKRIRKAVKLYRSKKKSDDVPQVLT